MKNVVRLPAVKNSKNEECLRLFYDHVETGIRYVKTLGVEINTYGPLLTDKRPDDLHLRKSRKYVNGVWKLSDILNLDNTA